jgi:hypothetical protein
MFLPLPLIIDHPLHQHRHCPASFTHQGWQQHPFPPGDVKIKNPGSKFHNSRYSPSFRFDFGWHLWKCNGGCGVVCNLPLGGMTVIVGWYVLYILQNIILPFFLDQIHSANFGQIASLGQIMLAGMIFTNSYAPSVQIADIGRIPDLDSQTIWT